MAVAGPRVQPSQRTDVHDSSLDSAQMRQCFPRNKKWAARVRLEDRVPLLQSDLLQRNGFINGGVVHNNVQPAELANRGGYRLTNGGFRTHVALDCQGAPAQRLNLTDSLFSFSF